MNEFVYIFAGMCVFVTSVVLYNLFVGVRGDLAAAKEGEVYRFEYLQPLTGDAERHMVKILGKRMLTTNEIARLNARSRYRSTDPLFMRTAHLITGQSSDGKIRNFYAERTINCKRSVIAGLLNKAGVL